MSLADPRAVRLFRVAHGKHLESFTRRGLLCRRTVMAEGLGFQSISDEGIEAARAATLVTCGPGGTLHDYVPFHFGPRSPMMCRISYRNLPNYTEGQRPLIYLVTSVGAVIDAGLPYVFADGHPIMDVTEQFDAIEDLSRIDHQIMRERMWTATPDDLDRERRRQAEFLVHERVPWDLITEIGVMDAKIKKRVEEILASSGSAHRPPVSVTNPWYYLERSK